MFSEIDWAQILRAFIALFLVIDILGSIPIIVSLKEKGLGVSAFKATIIAFSMLLGFFYAGDVVLRFFSVDIHAFAVAGALIICMMALEMITDVEIFKYVGPVKSATLVPLVFPLLAGSATFTTLLTLKAQCASINIIIALVLNMVWVYIVVRLTDFVERVIGKAGIYIIRKLFGIILLAVAIGIFMENLLSLIK